MAVRAKVCHTSGKYQFVKTISYLSAQHEVAPKEQALQCGECHMGSSRMRLESSWLQGVIR